MFLEKGHALACLLGGYLFFSNLQPKVRGRAGGGGFCVLSVGLDVQHLLRGSQTKHARLVPDRAWRGQVSVEGFG